MRITNTHVLLFFAIFALSVFLIQLFHNRWLMKKTSSDVAENSMTLTWQEAELVFKTFAPRKSYACKNIVNVGSTPEKISGEGIYPTCMDEVYQTNVPCLIYSFGIANQWEFEDDFTKRGCQVYAFDPSMNRENHKRAENLWFYNIGIGADNSDEFTPSKDDYVNKSKIYTWKIRTLKSIMDMLGHTNKMIDVLKMDIEGYEFDVLSAMMDDGTIQHVRQWLGEWHIFKNKDYDYPMKYSIAKRFWDHGFQVFKASVHGSSDCFKKTCEPFSFRIDLGLVNTKFG